MPPLNNLHLTALVKEGRTRKLYRIPLHDSLQRRLTSTWGEQLHSFTGQTQEIDFDPAYKPEDHERFSIHEYELPDFIAVENSETVRNLDPVDLDLHNEFTIQAIVAFAKNQTADELILFQNFTRSHVVAPGKFLWLDGNTFKTNDRTGLTLEGRLTAVFLAVEAKLLFSDFRRANTFLPLADYFQEATEQEITDILSHPKLAAVNAASLAGSANQWFSKRFAMLRDSGVLEAYSVSEIVEHSQGYEVQIQILQDNGSDKIVFPEDRAEAKRLLQFLNEELYRGAITSRLYETNSRRVAD